MNKIVFGSVVATTLSMLSPAIAHHSGASWDTAKEITVNGTVKEFQFTNPHSWLLVTVTDPTGKTTDWSFESEGPSTLIRAGIKKKSFMPGDKVKILAHPMKDGRLAGAMMSVTKADGSVYSPRTPPTTYSTTPPPTGTK